MTLAIWNKSLSQLIKLIDPFIPKRFKGSKLTQNTWTNAKTKVNGAM